MQPLFPTSHAALQRSTKYYETKLGAIEISNRARGFASLVEEHDISRVDIVELIARPLVEHVGIEFAGAEQRDALLAGRPLGFQPRQL
jgi:hypothetical protein